jgi:predicted ATPase
VGRICQMVEGMPLALELAAAWIPWRTCEEVAQDLECSLDVLSTRLRNVPQRHQSLRAALERSWNLLTEPEQALFQDLSVFRAEFTEEAAARVAEASPAMLSALVDKSLLRRDGSGRYDMHRLLRRYAEEKLREVPERQQAVENLLCEYYSEFLQ